MAFTNAESEHAAYLKVCALWYARGVLRGVENNTWIDNKSRAFADYVSTQVARYYNVGSPLDNIQELWSAWEKTWT